MPGDASGIGGGHPAYEVSVVRDVGADAPRRERRRASRDVPRRPVTHRPSTAVASGVSGRARTAEAERALPMKLVLQVQRQIT